MRNWLVCVEDDSTEARVVMSDIRQALGLASTFMLLGCRVSSCETQAPATHRHSNAAEAFIKLRQAQLDLPIMRVAGVGEIHRGIVT